MVYKDIEAKSYEELKVICKNNIADSNYNILNSFCATLMASTVPDDEFITRKNDLKEQNDVCNIKKGMGINMDKEEKRITETTQEIQRAEKHFYASRDVRIMLNDRENPIK